MKEKEILKEINFEDVSDEDLVEVNKKILNALPDGTKIFKDSLGRYFLKKSKEKSKETFLFEDSSNGTRLILESETCSMPELINYGIFTTKQFSKSKNLRRNYIG